MCRKTDEHEGHGGNRLGIIGRGTGLGLSSWRRPIGN